MIEDTDSDTDSAPPRLLEPEEVKPSGSSGALLATARSSKGLSVKEVAGRLCLSVACIEALETDNYTLLPEATFTRGYIKSYAQLVGLNPELVLSFYPGADESTENPRKMVVEVAAPVTGDGVKWLEFFAVLMVIVMIAFIVWYMWKEQPQQSADAISRVNALNDSVLVGLTGADNEVASSKSAELESNNSMRNAIRNGTERDTELDQVALVEAADLTENTSGNGSFKLGEDSLEDSLTVNCNSAVWVDIRGETGEKALYRTCKSGETISLAVDLPAPVFIAKIEGLELILNDREVDLSAHSNGQSYARFTLESWSNNEALPAGEPVPEASAQ